MTDPNTPLLSVAEINENLRKLSDWNLEDNGKLIVRNFKFENFKETIDFVNKVAEIAEQENHHPDLRIHGFNNLEISLSTHSIGGLTQRDFDVALKIDSLR